MSGCECAIRFRVIEPEPIRFDFSVTDYKERIVAPDEYSGATVVTPSDETQVLRTQDKLVRSDIVVNPAPVEQLTIDPLTQSGVITPSDGKVGFSQVAVEEDWDGVIYPIPDDPDKIFNAKWIPVSDGDTIIIEGYGRGRYIGTNGSDKIDENTMPSTIATNALPSPYFTKLRFEFTVRTLAADANVVLAGYQWTKDGTHSGNEAYQFRGDYLRWKVIHAS